MWYAIYSKLTGTIYAWYCGREEDATLLCTTIQVMRKTVCGIKPYQYIPADVITSVDSVYRREIQ